jgi:UDP-N-acetylglucosamine/UDP-N-acetylgalactosamine 4-epimerase
MGYQDIRFEPDTAFLITGGAGFIGSNLCETLLKEGYSVRSLDDLSNGKQANIDIFRNCARYSFIKGDVRHFDTCDQACSGIDYVLHQAAWGSVPRSILHPLLYEEINIKGTLNMMEAARKNKVKKFVYASSSSVFGDAATLPQVEGMEGNPLSPYAVTKFVNEKYGALYTRLYGLDTYGLRYFNVFGKRQDPDSPYAAVIPRFIKLLLKDERPTIYGDGMQSRDFTYIENVIEANIKACQASHEAAGRAYNIACGDRNYLIDVYNTICAALDKDIPPLFEPFRTGDLLHSHADISAARKMLHYEPDWNLQRGIAESVKWYKNNI